MDESPNQKLKRTQFNPTTEEQEQKQREENLHNN